MEGGTPVETVAITIITVITVGKVGPRALVVRQVIAIPEQAHPFQAVKADKACTGVGELEVLAGRMEADPVVPVITIITYLQAEVAVVQGILGAEVED
jgi:hypothetical protein